MDGFIASGVQGQEGLWRRTPSTIPPAPTRRRPTSWATTPRPRSRTTGPTPRISSLDDHMFEPVASWSLPDHLYLVSGWSAQCSSPDTVELHERASSARTPRHRCRGPWTRPSTPAPPTSPTPGPTSPGSSTTSTSRGPTTCRPETSPTATTTRPSPARRWRRAISPRASGTRSPSSRTCRRTIRSAISSRSNNYFAEAKKGTLPVGVVGHPLPGGQRAPARQCPPGAGLRHGSHQRRHEEPRLGLDGHLLAVGRLGRLLRPRGAAARRSERLRPARPGPGDLALRQEGLHRPARRCRATPTSKFIEDDFLGGSRLNPKTDKRPDPRPDVAGRRQDPGQHGQGLRLRPGAAGAPSCCRPIHRPTRRRFRPFSPAKGPATAVRRRRPARSGQPEASGQAPPRIVQNTLYRLL